MAFCPIVACPTLSEAVVVGLEEVPHGPGPDGVHGARLKVDEDSPGDVFVALPAIVVDLDPLRLYVVLVLVGYPLCVKSVLVGDDIPELAADLSRMISF